MKLRGARKSPLLSAGFTLLEIMVVIGIIAAVMALGAPRLLNTSSAMRSAVRDIAVMSREMRNNSRLFNMTTRLALTIDEKEGHSYVVESVPGNAPLLSEEQLEELEKLTEIQRQDEVAATKFVPEARIRGGKSKSLPRGLFIESVEYASRSDVITEGIAYIHYFPSGLVEEAAIHLTNRKTLNWTIAFDPLTGKADIFEGKIGLKELREKR